MTHIQKRTTALAVIILANYWALCLITPYSQAADEPITGEYLTAGLDAEPPCIVLELPEPIQISVEAEPPEDMLEEPEYISLGVFRITAYCPDKCCNGQWANMTATGAELKPYVTIAVDPRVIPYGSIVVIDGQEYIAEDCGGAIKKNRIDIAVETHTEAVTLGIRYTEIWLKQ